MTIYELIIMGIILALCGAGVACLIIDMKRQIKAYEERYESIENDIQE